MKFSHAPVVRRRACGGFLATTPRHYPLRIGVTANDRREVKIKYYHELRSWLKLLRRPRDPR